MKKKIARAELQLPEELKAQLQEVARASGQSVNSLVTEAARLRLAIPGDFWCEIERLAEALRLPAEIVLMHKVAKVICFEHAWLEVFGAAPPSAETEFRFSGGRLVTGAELVEELHREYTRQLTEAKRKLRAPAGETVVLTPAEMESVLQAAGGAT